MAAKYLKPDGKHCRRRDRESLLSRIRPWSVAYFRTRNCCDGRRSFWSCASGIRPGYSEMGNPQTASRAEILMFRLSLRFRRRGRRQSVDHFARTSVVKFLTGLMFDRVRIVLQPVDVAL